MILNFLVFLTFFLFSLGQLGRISFFGQQVNIYLYEICLFLTLLILLINDKFKPIKESYKKFKSIYFFLGFLFFAYLINLGSFKLLENIIGILYFFRLLMYFIYFFCFTYFFKKNPTASKTFLNSFFIMLSLTILFSVLQYFLYPDLRNLIYAGWDPHLYRLFGTFFDTSVAGAIYGLIFFWLFLKEKNFLKNKWIYFSLLFLFLIFIVLTYSRSLYLSLLIVTITATVAKQRYGKFFIFIVLFLAILFISPKPFGEGVNLSRMFSIESRFNDYWIAINIWSRNPVFGIGYNRIRYEKVKLNIIEETGSDLTHSGASFHSSFLIILVASGLIGLILFILVLINLAGINEFSRLGVIFLSLFSLSDNILLHPFVLFLFFSLILLTSVNLSRKSQ